MPSTQLLTITFWEKYKSSKSHQSHRTRKKLLGKHICISFVAANSAYLKSSLYKNILQYRAVDLLYPYTS